MLNWNEIISRIFEIYDCPVKYRLAEMLGVNKSVVSQWTTTNQKLWRKPTWEVLVKVVNDKGVTWDWLLEGREPKFREPTISSGSDEDDRNSVESTI